MTDLSLLTLRLVTGGLMAGHGAQKLFGAFDGPGRKGTAGIMGKLGLEPAEEWALMAGLSEFTGGSLTALGLMNPLGPVNIVSAMTMATGTAHWGKPIWTSSGGAELPAINMAAALAIAILGPGRASLDSALGVQVPKWVTGAVALVAGGMVAVALTGRAPAGEDAAGRPKPLAARHKRATA